LVIVGDGQAWVKYVSLAYGPVKSSLSGC